MVFRALCFVGFAAFMTCANSANVLGQTYAQQVIADGAIHYWRFEETSVDEAAKDEIPDLPANGDVPAQRNNPGVYEGGIELGHEGAFPALGNAARFDEQNGTHVALGDPQHPGPSISIEAWVLLEADHTVGFSPIFARWDGSYELDVNHAGQGGELDFVIRNDFNDFLDPHSAEPMTTDEWHHVVGIFNGESDGGAGRGRVYLDGELQECDTCVSELGGDLRDAGGDDGQWYIGRTRGPNSNFAWLGLIDEVAVYPFELSEQQIQDHLALAMGPASRAGDFNNDGILDEIDIELLSAEVRAGTNNTDFDLNDDELVDQADRGVWVIELKKTWFGDANLDGLFNSSDLVTVFTAGEYEDDIPGNSTWATGDWNGNTDFETSDLVTAFTDGGYEMGPREMAIAVPEPTAIALVLTGLLVWVLRPKAGRASHMITAGLLLADDSVGHSQSPK